MCHYTYLGQDALNYAQSNHHKNEYSVITARKKCVACTKKHIGVPAI